MHIIHDLDQTLKGMSLVSNSAEFSKKQHFSREFKI